MVRWSPDGNQLALLNESEHLIVADVKDRIKFRNIHESGFIFSNAAWDPEGTKLYYFETPYDDYDGVTGDSQLRVIDVQSKQESIIHPQQFYVAGDVDFSPYDGKLYFQSTAQGSRESVIMSYDFRTDAYTDITTPLSIKVTTGSRLSRDGKWLFINESLGNGNGHRGIILDLESGRRWTISDHYLQSPTWSPDKKWIAYARDHEVFLIPTDRIDVGTRILEDHYVTGLDWSPKGDRIVFYTGTNIRIDSSKAYLMRVPDAYLPC
ncbi:hypothetical protein [Paenibacillus sp. PL2-23]|uniref:WD40 repeat domain-containing protein n=1 Tax=Paenibacillus sp. PL2-23 TaxID=2100729 RepID=UPI0030F9C55A